MLLVAEVVAKLLMESRYDRGDRDRDLSEECSLLKSNLAQMIVLVVGNKIDMNEHVVIRNTCRSTRSLESQSSASR